MTRFAPDIKLRRLLTFVLVRVVTAETCHLTIQKALAGGQHAVLVTVHVYFSDRSPGVLPEEIEQVIPGLPAEGRFRF